MRVLVTGATGFLGGVVCTRLLARGARVTALGRDQGKLAVLAAQGCNTVAADLAAPGGSPMPEDARQDAIVHCAALSSPWGPSQAFVDANITGTANAIEMARQSGAARFVQVSTPALYFRFADQVEMREDAALPVPVNAYAATKRAAEALVLGADDLDPIILRPRGIYGAGDTALLPRLLRAASARPLPLMRDGTAATDLTHVDDVADAVLAALDAPPRPEQAVFNVSGGVALPVRMVAEAAGARAGVQVRWRRLPVGLVMAGVRAAEAMCARLPGMPEPPVTAYSAGLFAYTQTLDISAAAHHLGWRPKVDFADGLARTFAK